MGKSKKKKQKLVKDTSNSLGSAASSSSSTAPPLVDESMDDDAAAGLFGSASSSSSFAGPPLADEAMDDEAAAMPSSLAPSSGGIGSSSGKHGKKRARAASDDASAHSEALSRDRTRRHSICFQSKQAVRSGDVDLVVALWNVEDFGAGPSGMWARPQHCTDSEKCAALRKKVSGELRQTCDDWLESLAQGDAGRAAKASGSSMPGIASSSQQASASSSMLATTEASSFASSVARSRPAATAPAASSSAASPFFHSAGSNPPTTLASLAAAAGPDKLELETLTRDTAAQRARDAVLTKVLRRKVIAALTGSDITIADLRYARWHQRVRDVEHHCAATGADVVVILEAKTWGRAPAPVVNRQMSADDRLWLAHWIYQTRWRTCEEEGECTEEDLALRRRVLLTPVELLFETMIDSVESDEARAGLAYNARLHLEPKIQEMLRVIPSEYRHARDPKIAPDLARAWDERLSKNLLNGEEDEATPDHGIPQDVLDWWDTALDSALLAASYERDMLEYQDEVEERQSAPHIPPADASSAMPAQDADAMEDHLPSDDEVTAQASPEMPGPDWASLGKLSGMPSNTVFSSSSTSSSGDGSASSSSAAPATAGGTDSSSNRRSEVGLNEYKDLSMNQLKTIIACLTRIRRFRAAQANCNIELVVNDNNGLARELREILAETATQCAIDSPAVWTLHENLVDKNSGETILIRTKGAWSLGPPAEMKTVSLAAKNEETTTASSSMAATKPAKSKRKERPAWRFQVRHADTGNEVVIVAVHAPAPGRINTSREWFEQLTAAVEMERKRKPVVLMGDFNTKYVDPEGRAPVFEEFVSEFYAPFHPPYHAASAAAGTVNDASSHGAYLTSVKKSGGARGWSQPYDKILTFSDKQHFEHSPFRRSRAFELDAPAARRYSDHSYLIRTLRFSEAYRASKASASSSSSSSSSSSTSTAAVPTPGGGLVR